MYRDANDNALPKSDLKKFYKQLGLIFQILESKGYQLVGQKIFEMEKYSDQPIFTVYQPLEKKIFEADPYCDFHVYHPEKHKKCLLIKVKSQRSAGAPHNGLPFLVADIQKKRLYRTIIVLDQNNYRKPTMNWLRQQAKYKRIKIFNTQEFQAWGDGEGL